MARPEEKANAMMNKWVAMRDAGNAPLRPAKTRRPFLTSECDNLDDAERFRRQLIREVSDRISKIQNPGLGEHAIRDLNDEINKKLREKHHWNLRIRELGGPDFIEIERKQQLENPDPQNELVGSGGYRYFGAAKNLPGVKELFQRKAQKLSKRKRVDLWKNVTPDYFGWRDEEDGVLLELEAKTEKEAKQVLERRRAEYKRLKQEAGEDIGAEESDEEEGEPFSETMGDVLSQELVAQTILARKKQELLERLAL